MKKHIDTIWAVTVAIAVLSMAFLGGCQKHENRIVDGPVIDCSDPMYRTSSACIVHAS